MQTMSAGFGLGLSLILAIGAQNAFVLRQGLRRSHVFAVCLTCALSDAALIAAGVAGFGSLAQAAPWIEPVMRWGGALFLIVYGARALLSAWRGGAVLMVEGGAVEALGPVLVTCLALTWLNPHVYLDTVVLLGFRAVRSAALASCSQLSPKGYGSTSWGTSPTARAITKNGAPMCASSISSQSTSGTGTSLTSRTFAITLNCDGKS